MAIKSFNKQLHPWVFAFKVNELSTLTSGIMTVRLTNYRDKEAWPPYTVSYILCTLSVMCSMLHVNNYTMMYALVGRVVKFINAL